MKVITFSVLLLLTNAFASKAQHVLLGLKAGAALTAIAGPHVLSSPQVGPLGGFVGGLYKTIPLTATGRLALQPELLFSMQGYKLSNPATQYEATKRSYYVAIPVLATYTYHQFWIEAGPQLSYLMGIKERYTFSPTMSGTGLTMTTTSINPNGYPRWDIAYLIGIGYHFQSSIGIGLRYMGGISSLYLNSGGEHHVGYQLQVSYPLLQIGR